jgi:5-hydroxyisourate hydrolase-like protein (transthyretin family)
MCFRKTALYVNRLYICLTVSIFITTLGCSRLPEKPEGLPDLYPCKIVVTFDGQPIEGVNVSLRSTDVTDTKWRSGGKTDKNGVANLRTSFAFTGAPEGTFVIAFEKIESRVGNTVEEMTPLSLIPLKYSIAQSNEIIEIKPNKNVYKFELDAGSEPWPNERGLNPKPAD